MSDTSTELALCLGDLLFLTFFNLPCFIILATSVYTALFISST